MAVSLICNPALHALAGYEDGRVVLFKFTGTESQAFNPPTRSKDEGEGWELLWEEKGHREARSSDS